MPTDIGLITPQQLDLTMPLNAPDTVTWAQNLHDPMSRIERLSPSNNDWRVERNGVPLTAGVFYDNGVDVDTDSRSLNISGAGYLYHFSKCYLTFDPYNTNLPVSKRIQNLEYVDTDLFDVLRGLINAISGQVGGDDFIPLTFWSNTQKAGVNVTIEFLASDQQDLLTMVTDLAGRIDGFDFWIDANCVLHAASPHRGSRSSLVLMQGRNIERVQYQNAGLRANRVIAIGSGTGSTQVVAVSGETSETDEVGEARLLTEVAQFSNLSNPNQIKKLAIAENNLASQDQVTLTVTSRPVAGENHWAMASVGDWIRVVYDLEYVNVDDYFRCTQIELTPTDQGDEIIVYTFAPNTINTGQ